MTQKTESAETRPEPPPLKVVEREPDPADPWADDVLDHKDIAHRLTRIIEGQEAPFVISVDGRWGTGKTFLLKRWAQDLGNHDPKWHAIYYNAWEDDFADDPLLAIIGQLSEHFAKGRFRRYLPLLGKFVAPLLHQGASIALAATTGVLLPPIPASEEAEPPQGALSNYHQRRQTKESLRRVLKSMSERVARETGQPLVVVIDELDRCRPTFAIELLERVKHIFDVHNIVFVFGINRDELTKSLKSVYGEIEAGVYLRRFFDMEFILPEAGAEEFCTELFERYHLASFFEQMTAHAKNRLHAEDFRAITRQAPVVFQAMGLSLRDMDYCVRALALVGRSMEPRHYMHPFLLIVLVALRIDSPDRFRKLVQEECRVKEVVEYLDERFHSSGLQNRERERVFDFVEVSLYSSDEQAWRYFAESMWPDQPNPTPPGVFSQRTETEDGRLARLAQEAPGFHELSKGSLAHVARLIDLLQSPR